jgi:YegS/Rv2252/BmrU family lipid kinase
LIVVAGGDGTINEVVNGMAYSDVPLAILPAGTANVLAMELGIGRRIARTAELLTQYIPARVAIGRMVSDAGRKSRYFLLMAGVGLDAYVIYNLVLRLKAPLGKAAYWLSALAKLGRRIPEFVVQAEGREFRSGFAIASRVRNYGGDLEIACGASLLSDQFELVLFEGTNRLNFVRYMLGVVTHRHLRMRGVTILRARTAVFLPLSEKKVHLQLDGEYSGLAPARVEVIPNALNLLVPPEFITRIHE